MRRGRHAHAHESGLQQGSQNAAGKEECVRTVDAQNAAGKEECVRTVDAELIWIIGN